MMCFVLCFLKLLTTQLLTTQLLTTQRDNCLSAIAVIRDCGQAPGTCNADMPGNTRHVSLYMNVENALLRSSLKTFCIHFANVDAQVNPCSLTIYLTHASLNHCQSFL